MNGLALKYFLEVCRTGSLSAASAASHVAISAISRQISQLEEQVGSPLFQRTSRGMQPTEAGSMLLAHARRTALETASTLAAIASLRGMQGREIRVASSQGPANDLVPAAMAEFRKQHPETRYSLHVGASQEATQRVADGDSDIAVTFSVTPHSGVVVQHAWRARVLAIMAAGHPLAHRPIVSLAELGKFPLALTDKGTSTRTLFDISCGMANLPIEPVLSSNYAGSLHAFVRESNAILLAGYVSIAERLARNGLVARPIQDAEMQSRSLQIQTMAGRLLSSDVESFIAHLARTVQRLGDGSPPGEAGETENRQCLPGVPVHGNPAPARAIV